MEYSDTDLLYLFLKLISTPEGVIIAVIVISILFWIAAFIIGAFRTIAEIETINEITKNDNQTHNTN